MTAAIILFFVGFTLVFGIDLLDIIIISKKEKYGVFSWWVFFSFFILMIDLDSWKRSHYYDTWGQTARFLIEDKLLVILRGCANLS